MNTPEPTPPGGDQTMRAGDTTALVPADVREAAGDVSRHFGPRGPDGRPKYYKIRALGKGGMGTVFLAWETNLNRYVAIKFLIGSPTEDSIKRFRREAQACAGLRHPHIVSIHEADVWQDTPFIAMDYIEGSSLADIYARKGQTRADAVRWVAQVARALQAAHDRQIIHRDIKPHNIFIDGHGFPYLGDFGLAKSLGGGEELTAQGVMVGTPSYMAPEQAADDGRPIGPRTDVYALGAVLYEGVTGRRPYVGTDALSILHKVLHEPVAPPRQIDPSVPADLEAVILKAMAREPHARYESAREFADVLDRLATGQPAPTPQRNPIPLVAALLVLAGAATGVWYWQRHRTPAPPVAAPPVKPKPAPPTPGTVHVGEGVKIGGDVFKKTMFDSQDTWTVEIPGIDLKGVKMRQHWEAIWKIARAWKEDAVLVRIWGQYVKEDGTIDASDPNDYQAGWSYQFYSAATPAKRFDNDSDKRMALYIRNGRTFINSPSGNCSDIQALPKDFLDSDAIWKLIKSSTGAKTSGHLGVSMNLEWPNFPLHRGDFTGASDSGDVSVVFDFVTGEISE